ncbi:MAG: Mut7-C RNAse domain-containing protein [Candidatus Micrarchaeaceae archaeon]
MEIVQKKLVADAMLEKLARWIRLSGTKIATLPFSDDNDIIRYVKRRNATLLTQDEQLAARSNRRKFKVLLVKGASVEEQLAFVACSLNLKIHITPAYICPYCNATLVKMKKKSVQNRIPDRVAKSHTSFYMCKKCKRIYWRGTHWNNISARLRRALLIKNQICNSGN